MAYTTATIVERTLREGELSIVLEYTGTTGEIARRRTIFADTPDLSTLARGDLDRLNHLVTSAGALPVGTVIDTTPPPGPTPDDLAMTQFVTRWLILVGAKTGVDLGVLSPVDADVLAVRTAVSDQLAAASAAEKRRLLRAVGR